MRAYRLVTPDISHRNWIVETIEGSRWRSQTGQVMCRLTREYRVVPLEYLSPRLPNSLFVEGTQKGPGVCWNCSSQLGLAHYFCARIQIHGRPRSTRNFGKLKTHIRMDENKWELGKCPNLQVNIPILNRFWWHIDRFYRQWGPL